MALPQAAFAQQQLRRTGPSVTSGGGGVVGNRGEYGNNNATTGSYHYIHQAGAPGPQAGVAEIISMIWDEPPRYVQEGQVVTVFGRAAPGAAKTTVLALKEPGAHPTRILMSGTQLPTTNFNDGITEGYLGYQASGPPTGSFQNYNLIQQDFYHSYTVSTATPTVTVHVRIRGGNLSFNPATTDFVHSLTWTYVPVTAGSVSMSNLSPSPAEPLEAPESGFAADITYQANFATGSLVLQLVDPTNTIQGSVTQAITQTASPQTVRMSLPTMTLTPDLCGSKLRVQLLNSGLLVHEAWSQRFVIGPGLRVLKVVEGAEYKTGTGAWLQLTPGVVLKQGDLLSTGPDADVFLRFADGSIMAVHELTEIMVSALLRLGNAYTAQVYLKLGEISAQVNPDKKVSSDFSVKTPIATASVRGTNFAVAHFELPQPKSLFLVKEGLVETDPEAEGLATMQVAGGEIARVTGTTAYVEPLPELSLSQPAPGQVLLTWPAPSPGMTTNAVLEASTTMLEDSWLLLSHSTNGSVNSHSSATLGPARFFRLHYVIE